MDKDVRYEDEEEGGGKIKMSDMRKRRWEGMDKVDKYEEVGGDG